MEPDPSLLNELNCFLENAQRMKIEFKHMMEEIDQCINEIKSYNSIEDTKSRMNSLLKRQVHEDAQALQQSTPILELITFPKLTYNQHIPFYQTSYLYHSKSIVLKSFARARMPGEITFIDCGSFTKTIVIGGDGFLRGFNKENGYCIGEWIVTNPSFRNCVYCAVPHYYHIVFGTDDGFVRFLNTSTFSVEEEFPAHSAPVTKLLSII